MSRFFFLNMPVGMCLTVALFCPSIASDLSTVRDMGDLLSTRSGQSNELDELYIEWQQDTKLSSRYHEEAIAKKKTFVDTKCRMATKGKWRFYDANFSPLAGW